MPGVEMQIVLNQDSFMAWHAHMDRGSAITVEDCAAAIHYA